MRSVFSIFALLAALPVQATELPAPTKAIEEVVDQLVDAALQQAKVTPAPLADDATYLRRVTLDLCGRIPTAAEMQAYITAVEPDKKVKLVDRLLASSAYVRHQVTEFDVMLASRPGELRDYLRLAFTEGRGWDRIFRELMLPNEDDPKTKGSSAFLRTRVSDLDRLTNEVSVLFFGVNVSCAQCHDHPRVEDWKQDHFFGMKAFLSRTFDAGGAVGERGVGLVKFKPNKGAEKQARMMFLTGKKIEHASWREPTNDERKQDQMLLEESRRKKAAPPVPSFSARRQLVELALQAPERDFLARSIVNRLWQRYLGLGLVAPLDQMHSENPPSHPELLTWLARDLIGHNYDLKRVTRGLVLSKAYARASRWDGETPPKPSLFAVARVRPLTPTQMAMSLRLATSDPQSFVANPKTEDLDKRLENVENTARGSASMFEQPRDDFQISVSEALLFSNSDRIQKEMLSDSSDRLLGRLKLAKTPQEMVDVAIRNVFCRPPRPDETEILSAFLQKRSDRPQEAARQLVWALLTSSEFRFNH